MTVNIRPITRDELAKIFGNNQRVIRAFEQVLKLLPDDVNVLNEDVSGLNDGIASLNDSVTTLNNDVSSLNTSVSSLNTSVSSLNSSVSSLNTQVSEFEFNTQRASPSSNGFSVSVSATTNKGTYLILTPTATFSSGTIVLPTSPADKKEVLVSVTQGVTTLSISTSSSLYGAPTTISAGDFFKLRYDQSTNAWYRVG